MGAVVRADSLGDGHRQAVEDAAVFLGLQAQAYIPRLDLDPQRVAHHQRDMGHAHLQRAIGQLQSEQLIVRVVGNDAAGDHHAGIVAQRQGQVEARQGLADRATGQGLAVAEQDDMVGQSRHFVLGMLT